MIAESGPVVSVAAWRMRALKNDADASFHFLLTGILISKR